jgi:threonine dehydratase
VYGVEPAAGNDVQQSLARGERVRIPVPETIADGAQTTQVGALTFPIIQRAAAGVLTAEDAQLVQCMRLLAERLKIVVEPTACLGLAAALAQRSALAGKRVGVILSGGNVELAVLAQLLQGGRASTWEF